MIEKMNKLPPQNDECIHQTIERGLINSSIDFHNAHENCSLPAYLYSCMTVFAKKIYESAPSCEEAEMLFKSAIREAKQIYIQQ